MAASRHWGQPRDSRRPCADGSRPSAERSACPRRTRRSGCASSNLPSSRSNNRKRKAPLRWRHGGGVAGTFARRRVEPVEHSVLLEGQKVTAKAEDSKARLDELARETSPRLFWD